MIFHVLILNGRVELAGQNLVWRQTEFGIELAVFFSSPLFHAPLNFTFPIPFSFIHGGLDFYLIQGFKDSISTREGCCFRVRQFLNRFLILPFLVFDSISGLNVFNSEL